MKKPKISIIILNYNTKKLLDQVISSVLETTNNIDFEIIVSDNNSSDGSIEMVKNKFPQVILIENKENGGFAKGNNIAIEKSSGEFILLLNSDTIVQKDCIEKCVAFLEAGDEKMGAVGCRVLLKDGTLDHACRRGFPTPSASFFYFLKFHKLFPHHKTFSKYTLSYLSEFETNEVDALTGAFMLLKRDVIKKVGLLDEDFFMYGEDLDWCFRIKESGYKIMYYPEVSIIHLKGQSSKKRPVKITYAFYNAMIIFYKKHYKNKYNRIVNFFMYLAIYTKFVLSLLKGFFKNH